MIERTVHPDCVVEDGDRQRPYAYNADYALLMLFSVFTKLSSTSSHLQR